MFVKIIDHRKEHAIDTGCPRTTCFECREYTFTKPQEGDPEGLYFLLLLDQGLKHSKRIGFTREEACKTSVIIENHEGKTVHKYVW